MCSLKISSIIESVAILQIVYQRCRTARAIVHHVCFHITPKSRTYSFVSVFLKTLFRINLVWKFTKRSWVFLWKYDGHTEKQYVACICLVPDRGCGVLQMKRTFHGLLVIASGAVLQIICFVMTAPPVNSIHKHFCISYKATWSLFSHRLDLPRGTTLKAVSFAPGASSRIGCRWYHYLSVRKVSEHFFCENLVDFSEARLHEATLNLHTHASIFSRLTPKSVC